MEIVLLDEIRYNDFACNHPNYNMYQSVNYGKLMKKCGYDVYYLGLEDGEIKAATLVIVKNEEKDRRKMCYAPRGFLIDWNDSILVKNFTEKLVEFLSKRGFTYLKVDPYIVYKTYKGDGNISTDGPSNENFVTNLQSMGYIHLGYNKGMEANKPRYYAVANLDANIDSVYNAISEKGREKIIDSLNAGCRIYKGTNNDIHLMYDMFEKTDPKVDYYLDFYECFGSDFEVYFTKLEPVIYVNKTKELYEKESENNSNLNQMIQRYDITNKEQIINEKLKSDELLSKYKNNMNEAVNLFQKYPAGRILAACCLVKQGSTINIIDSGYRKDFDSSHPDYLLKWQLVDQYSKLGFSKINYGGITGEFDLNPTNLNNMEVATNIYEYVGEFDLVINKKAYYTGSRLNPILDWLNKPI